MKLRTTGALFAALALALLASAVAAQETFQHARLTRLWESPPGLATPESALYDPASETIYVSNINMGPWVKDGNGFLSKLSLTGAIVTREWVKGLSAPKGMGIHSGRLYVTDVDELVEIDIAHAAILARYGHPLAKNLNDVAIGPDGTVYVSDSAGRAVFAFKTGKLDVFLESDAIPNPNGLWVSGGELLCGLRTRAVAVDLKTKSVRPFVEDTGRIDGFVPTGDGAFLISDWTGAVHLIKPGQPLLKLLDTTPRQVYAADIDFIVAKKMLLVPTFFDNHVVAYRLD